MAGYFPPMRARVAVVGFVMSADGSQLLSLYHNANASDPSYGMHNGISGDLRSRESVAEAMFRVVEEETGRRPSNMQLRGVVHWSGFGPERESVLGHIFRIHGLEGGVDGIPKFVDRGQLKWVDVGSLLNGDLPMFDGDRKILPEVLRPDPRPFFGYMPYENGRPSNWICETFPRYAVRKSRSGSSGEGK